MRYTGDMKIDLVGRSYDNYDPRLDVIIEEMVMREYVYISADITQRVVNTFKMWLLFGRELPEENKIDRWVGEGGAKILWKVIVEQYNREVVIDDEELVEVCGI